MASQEIILITGANTGLGLETVRALAASDKTYSIILGSRTLSKANDAIASLPASKSKLSSIQIDVDSDESIQAAFEKVQSEFGKVDVLINNAGAQFDPQYQEGKLSMRETWNKSWNTNTTGAQVMTFTFVPLLLKSSNPRLLFITSGVSTLAGTENMAIRVNHEPPKGWPKESFGVPAYRSSKTGLNMMMREWHRVLKNDGVKVWAISPGMLVTGLGPGAEYIKAAGGIDPAIGANFVKDVVEGARDADVGLTIQKDQTQPW